MTTPEQPCLRTPTERDGPALLAAVTASRALHRGWVEPPADVETFFAWLARARRQDHDTRLVCVGEELAGVVSCNAIVRGPVPSAQLGFYALAPHAGRGWMGRALRLALDHARDELGLRRLEAHVQPTNHRSRRLLTSLGFAEQGPSPLRLRIGGYPREHHRWIVDLETVPARARAAQAGSRQSIGSAP
jgi:[ribosomal protein S5]-alanine N-acetyltransferase